MDDEKKVVDNFTSDGQLDTDQTINYVFQDGVYRGYRSVNEPQVVYANKAEVKKKNRKKGMFKKAFRFTAVALVFGILAGAGTSGYDYITRQTTSKQTDDIAEEIVHNETPVTTLVNEGTPGNIVSTSNGLNGVITDVSDVVEKVLPSIVAINSSAVITKYDFFGRQFNQSVEGSGSGIIIAQNNDSILIVTNNHVVADTKTVEIVFTDDTTATATIKGTDSNSDLAVLQVYLDEISEDTLNTIRVATLGDSNQAKAGQMAIAIGNALGYGQAVTVGYIGATNREVTIDNITMTLLQTDAAINPGNSGGALINTLGEVIGINSVKFASTDVEGMGYAIPITDAIPMINRLMNREVIQVEEVGFLGVNLQTAQEVTESYASQFNMPVGVYINDVVEKSPAQAAGLKSGYIITTIDDMKIDTIDKLIEVIGYYRVGEKIEVHVSYLHDGAYEEKTLEVTLGAKTK